LGHSSLFSISLAIVAHVSLSIHQGIHRNASALGHLIVIKVMRASNFNRTRAWFRGALWR
jgi:hypothetical protein